MDEQQRQRGLEGEELSWRHERLDQLKIRSEILVDGSTEPARRPTPAP